MILVINTEYEKIYLYSKNVVDIELIQIELAKIEKEFDDWEIKRENFLKENNIDLKEHKYKMENIQYELRKHGNTNEFVLKRFKDLQKIDDRINEFNHIYPHPQFSVKEKIEKLGLEELNINNADIRIDLSLERNKIKVNI